LSVEIEIVQALPAEVRTEKLVEETSPFEHTEIDIHRIAEAVYIPAVAFCGKMKSLLYEKLERGSK
jgi:hypothetical protein